MLFSIIIPVYNVENHLQECIDSVVNQIVNYAIDAEIVLLDDGSKDMSGKICDNNYNKYPDIIRVVHKKNEGLLSTRRKGLLLAKGEYIINCDSDDFLSENALYEIKKIIDKSHPDIVIYNMGIFDGHASKPYYQNSFTNREYIKIGKKQILKSYFIDDYPIVTTMAGKAIKATCFNLNKDYSKFYADSFGEDTLQSAEVFENAENIIYLNKVLYYYRSSSGMSAKFKEDYYDNFLQIIENVLDYPYILNNDEISSWFNVKMLNTLARSITQSKNSNSMNYKERKKYLIDLYGKKYVKEILNTLNSNRRFMSFKYWFILLIFKYKCFLLLHKILLL